jgi:hypothetical protein
MQLVVLIGTLLVGASSKTAVKYLFLINIIDSQSSTCGAIESTTHLYYIVIKIVRLDNNLYFHYSLLSLTWHILLFWVTKTSYYWLMSNHFCFKVGDWNDLFYADISVFFQLHRKAGHKWIRSFRIRWLDHYLLHTYRYITRPRYAVSYF